VAYDAPAATAAVWHSRYGLSSKLFGSLFTIYSAPNSFLVFYAGRGVRKSSLVFNGMVLLATFIIAIAPYSTESSPARKLSGPI
jgi:hypothetical protein